MNSTVDGRQLWLSYQPVSNGEIIQSGIALRLRERMNRDNGVAMSRGALRKWAAKEALYMGYALVAFGLFIMGVVIFGALVWVSSEWPRLPVPNEEGADSMITIFLLPLLFGSGYGVVLLGRLLVATASRLDDTKERIQSELNEHRAIRLKHSVDSAASTSWLKSHCVYAGYSLVVSGFVLMGLSVLTGIFLAWSDSPGIPPIFGALSKDSHHGYPVMFWRVPLFFCAGYAIVLLGRLVVAATRRWL